MIELNTIISNKISIDSVLNSKLVAFLIFRLFTVQPKPQKIKVLKMTLGAYVLATCLAAIVLIPFLDHWINYFWISHSQHTGAHAISVAKKLEFLITLFLPHFYQIEPVMLDFTRTDSSRWGHIGLMEGAPHPNAAKVYINWLLSKSGQELLAKATATNSRRTDFAPFYPETFPKPERLNQYIRQNEPFVTSQRKAQGLARRWIK